MKQKLFWILVCAYHRHGKELCFGVDNYNVPLADCEISDDILGDCCRETGDDWGLTNLTVKAKVTLFRFLCNQSLKASVFR